jgi:hypothetical protein
MIVPRMTHEEVRKEFLHDWHRATAKANNSFTGLLMNLHRRKMQHAVETVIWKTPSNNRWMMIYFLDGKNSTCAHVCLTLDHGGFLKTLSPVTDMRHPGETFIAEYNIHFYKRYNERLKLGLTRTEKIVKHFFRYNSVMDGWSKMGNTESENKLNLFMPVKGGVALGFAYDTFRFIEMKTFVSDEMLRESQMETAEYLRHYNEKDHPPAAPLL